MIKLLEIEFLGEAKGFKYILFHVTTYAYIYLVEQNGTFSHYEVFERKIAPMCIDFEKRIYSDTEFKEIYPKANDFGKWAFAFKTYLESIGRSEKINKKLTTKLIKTIC